MSPAPALRLRYTVSMPRPHTHLLEVQLRIEGWTDDLLDLSMPAWTPGSYLIRDYSKHVVRFQADGARWSKQDKGTWRIHARGRKNLTVRYTVYANELTVRTSHLDDTHAHLHGAGVFMYIPGHMNAPITVEYRVPAGWKMATALDRTGPRTFAAPDYDTLVDSPVEIGTFQEHTFRVRGRRHEIAIHGTGNFSPARMARDIRKLVEVQTRFFGEAPYPRYTFLLHTTPQGRGGLEHKNSTSLIHPELMFEPRERYEEFLGLVSHEYFHLWNVKRIRPADLTPFDYRRENYTTLLWVCEGITSYYDELFVCRAGLMSPRRFLEKKAEQIQSYESKPGRQVQSLAEAGFDAWIKHYQPNENSVNATMSYYEKGRLVGMLLDMAIRAFTRGRRSLDDVMRALNIRFARRGRGYTADDFMAICSQAAGRTMDAFFSKYVYGTTPLDWAAAFRTVGLHLAPRLPRPAAAPYLGIQTSRAGDRMKITHVLSGSPAYAHGLNAGDELVAVDGRRADPDEWEKRIAMKKPGAGCAVTVFRNGVLRQFRVRLGVRRKDTLAFGPLPKPSPLQKRLFRRWLGFPWSRTWK